MSVGIEARSGLALTGLLTSGMIVVDVERGEVLRTIATREGPDPMAVIRLPLVMSGA